MNLKRRFFLKILTGGGVGILFFNKITLGETLVATLNKKNKTTMGKIIFPFFQYIKKYNIGDFIPKDQGGKFIQMDIMETEDDEQIVEKIRNGILEKIYGTPIGWERFEKTEVEKSVWLNRFYYLPSFARMYFLTKDISYVSDMVNIISRWINENPRLPDSHSRTYNWRDMQVAWRAIHWSWCYYLTAEALSRKQQTIIKGSLSQHADILLTGFGKQKLNEFNHQSHGALAMLYLGILFPSLKESGALIETGIKILSHHLEHAFYNDGGNVEQMFGYYPFEAHIFRDAYLLCSENNEQLPASIVPMLVKMAKFLSVTSQPNSTTPPINDSYEMPVLPILDTLNNIIDVPLDTSQENPEYLPDTQIGVIRGNSSKNKWYVLANTAKDIGAHSHAGRLSFTAWHNGQPCLIDSGCCNYDDPLLFKWYRTSRAHNTVIIDGKSDGATSSNKLWVPRRTTQNRISDWVKGDTYTYCSMFSPASEEANSSVSWYRNLALVKNQLLVLHDCFISSDEHTYELLFHFPPIEINANQENKTIKISKKDPLVITPANTKTINELIITEGMVSVKGKNTVAPMAIYKFQGKGIINSVMFFVPENEFSSLQIKQEETNSGIGVSIAKQKGEKTILLMRNPDAEELNLWGYKTQKTFDVF